MVAVLIFGLCLLEEFTKKKTHSCTFIDDPYFYECLPLSVHRVLDAECVGLQESSGVPFNAHQNQMCIKWNTAIFSQTDAFCVQHSFHSRKYEYLISGPRL